MATDVASATLSFPDKITQFSSIFADVLLIPTTILLRNQITSHLWTLITVMIKTYLQRYSMKFPLPLMVEMQSKEFSLSHIHASRITNPSLSTRYHKRDRDNCDKPFILIVCSIICSNFSSRIAVNIFPISKNFVAFRMSAIRNVCPQGSILCISSTSVQQ